MSKKRRLKAKSNEDKHSQLWLCLCLGLLILIFYANSFSAGLLFDSDTLVRQDPRLRALNWANIRDIFTHDYWWPAQPSALYRPLTTLTYLFNYTVLGNGENASGYHAVNIVLHWANVWLVLLIVRRLAGRLDVTALTASLFAVHPVNTEAVTNVVGRADLLATLCILFGGWCYLQAVDSAARNRRRWLTVMGAMACLGVLAKETGVMIVAFVGLYDFLWRWPALEANNWRERLKTALKEFGGGYAALIPALLLIWWIRRWMVNSVPVFGEVFVDNPLIRAAPFQGFMTAMGVIGRYLKLLVFPRTLSADYSFNQIPLYGAAGNSGGDIFAWISVAAVALLIAAALWLRRRQRFFSWGVLFLFVMMLPTSNLLLTIGSIMAERFLYLPSIGFCAVAALGLFRLGEAAVSFEGLKPRAAIVRWVLPAVVISALGVRTFLRNADWHDDLSLWKATVAASPGSFKAHMVYGDAIWADAQETSKPLDQAIDEAIAQEEIARSILEPDPPIPLESQNNTVYVHLAKDYRIKAQFLEDNGRHDEARGFYEKSLDALLKAQVVDRATNQTWREFKLRHGVSPEAIADIGNFLVYESLALTYAKLGQWENCEMAARFMERIAPDQPSGYQLVGAACFNLHRYADAAVQFIAGMLIDPGNSDWLASLSRTYNNLGIQPHPVTQGPNLSLNTEIPLVRQQLHEAAAIVVRLFDEAKKPERARELQDQFIKQYSVPPELFSRK